MDLSLRQQIAQMVIVRASGYLFDHQIQYPDWEPPADTLKHWIQELGVGGVILLGGSAVELGMRSHLLQSWTSIPLLIAADVEEGVGQRFTGATWFPPPMALGAIAQSDLSKAIRYAETMGSVIAQEALAIGINWLLAPVVDVNNNPQNPGINVRSFGETANEVTRLATAFIYGTQRHPILTTAKHFPGHGDTAIDSHLELPVLPHSLERLAEVEMPPFGRAIAEGVDAVMTAHLQIPALDSTYPATLSHRILTEELRQRLGFTGLIVTDALIMGAIADHYGKNEAPVLAVEAGADILLMPADPAGAIQAICEAVETGRIALERIQSSAERICKAKHRVCSPSLEAQTSHAWETILLPSVQLNHLAQPEAIATVRQILQDSMTTHHPPTSRLQHFQWLETAEQVDTFKTPNPFPLPLRNLILLDSTLNCSFLGRQAAAIALPAQFGYQLQVADCHTPNPLLNPESIPWQPTLLQLFIRGNPFRGSAGLTQIAQQWLEYLVKSNQLQALVIYGSPYVLEQFLPQLPHDLPYVFTYGQMPEAQAIALNALFTNSAFTSTVANGTDRLFTD